MMMITILLLLMIHFFFQYRKEFRLNVFFMSDISMKVKELGLIRVKQLQRIKYRYQSESKECMLEIMVETFHRTINSDIFVHSVMLYTIVLTYDVCCIPINIYVLSIHFGFSDHQLSGVRPSNQFLQPSICLCQCPFMNFLHC